MFHSSNFGSFAMMLSVYTDIDGYVPESGDSPEDGNWPEPNDFMEDGEPTEEWEEFLAAAIEATEEAEAALDEWRDRGLD